MSSYRSVRRKTENGFLNIDNFYLVKSQVHFHEDIVNYFGTLTSYYYFVIRIVVRFILSRRTCQKNNRHILTIFYFFYYYYESGTLISELFAELITFAYVSSLNLLSVHIYYIRSFVHSIRGKRLLKSVDLVFK